MRLKRNMQRWVCKRFLITVISHESLGISNHCPLIVCSTDKKLQSSVLFTHCLFVSIAWFTFCRWGHNRLLMTSQWPDSCDVITWKGISNSLDIDFIHGDIHSRWCKKIGCCFYINIQGKPDCPMYMSLFSHIAPILCSFLCGKEKNVWFHMAFCQ